MDAADLNLEGAMLRIAHATDGAGNAVNLYSGPIASSGLREATRVFAENGIERNTVFFNGPKAEAAYWDNLALLARATAAAIRVGV